MANKTYHPRDVPVHGYAVRSHPFYMIWANLIQRCTNKKNNGYANYGGRGIKVCSRWRHFENFAVDMWPRPEGPFTIERVDNDGDYEKGNCRWATRTEQCINRRTFRNNKSGYPAVVSIGARYEARFDFEHVRYRIGRFDTADEAFDRQQAFVDLFFNDREAACASIAGETVWCTSSTKVRGVTPHADGGFTSRATKNGVRHYLGYFQSIEEARDARTRFLAE